VVSLEFNPETSFQMLIIPHKNKRQEKHHKPALKIVDHTVMALFESSWDTRASNAALLSESAKSKSGRKEKERHGSKSGAGDAGNETAGAGPSIDLDKLLKKMANTGVVEKEKEKKRKGKSRKEKADRPAKLDAAKTMQERRKRTAPSSQASEKMRKGKEIKAVNIDEVEPAAGSGVGRKREAEAEGGDSTMTSKAKKQRKNKKEKAGRLEEGGSKKTGPVLVEAAEPGEEESGGMSELQQLMRKNLQGSKFRYVYSTCILYCHLIFSQDYQRKVVQVFKSRRSRNDAQRASNVHRGKSSKYSAWICTDFIP
jgi:hypothetical protein